MAAATQCASLYFHQGTNLMHLHNMIAVLWPDFHVFNLVKVKYEKSRTGLNPCAGLLAESRTDTVLVKDYARIKESFGEQEPASLHTA